jgi:hypothetical protein
MTSMYLTRHLFSALRPAHKCYENYSITPPHLAVMYKATPYVVLFLCTCAFLLFIFYYLYQQMNIYIKLGPGIA